MSIKPWNVGRCGFPRLARSMRSPSQSDVNQTLERDPLFPHLAFGRSLHEPNLHAFSSYTLIVRLFTLRAAF